MVEIPSLLRHAEHKALSAIHLEGRVLDIGGSKASAYQALFKKTCEITTVNLDPYVSPDIVADLEEPLAIAHNTYDGVLLVNVLEHIFNYRQLLSESVRVLKPGGTLVVVVPFLFPVHPSPGDFHRFSAQALERLCEGYMLQDVSITPLGTGVFSARYLLLDRLLPWPLRAAGYITVRYIALLLDILFIWLAHLFGKKYDPADYALGYCLTAKKPINT